MRKELKRFRILIFALSILVAFCFVFPLNDSMGELRFLSSYLSLGGYDTAADQEDLMGDPPVQSKIIVSSSLLNFTLGIHPFQDSFPFSSPSFSFKPNISILRC